MPPFPAIPALLRSFRSQLSLGLGGIALVMLVATMVYFGQLIAEQASRNATQGLQRSAGMAADLLAVGLQERRREVVLLSTSPVLQQGDLLAPALRARSSAMCMMRRSAGGF